MRARTGVARRQDGVPTTASELGEPSRDDAVELLFRKHYSELIGLAYCMVGSRESAEDAVQDAFASLYRHWNRLRDRNAASAYLRSAVLNRCRTRIGDLLKQRAVTGDLLVLTETVVEPAAPVADVELVRAIQLLPRRQKEVLACRYYLELGVTETAALLGISVGSVKRHTFRALTALSSRLEATP
jgi:RNA polymerase sigma factor (sigma-70 family)